MVACRLNPQLRGSFSHGHDEGALCYRAGLFVSVLNFHSFKYLGKPDIRQISIIVGIVLLVAGIWVVAGNGSYQDTETVVKQIGRAHVRTPVTNAHLVCRLLLEKQKRRKQKSKRHTLRYNY